MGLLGSTLGRGLAGAAMGASQVVNQYITKDIELQKAQALAELQRTTAGNIRADDDAFQNDPMRVQRNRDNKVADITAVGQANNDVALQGKLAEAGSQQLTDAEVARQNTIVAGTEKTRTDAEVARAAAMLPLKVKEAYAMADASASATAKYREARVQPGDELKAKIAVVEQTMGRPLTEQEKLGILGLNKGRDPELDTQSVTEEKMNPDGTTTKTTRKEVRRPGDASAAGVPPKGPAVGTVMNGFKFNGGDPNSQASWEPVQTKQSLFDAAASSQSFRPFGAMSSSDLSDALAGKNRRISPAERQMMLDEIGRRKDGDIR